MVAHFYIVNETFAYPTSSTILPTQAEIEDAIKALAIDCEYIRQHKNTNKIILHESIYDELIYQNINIVDFLYTASVNAIFDKDTVRYLQIIIEKAEQCNLTINDILILLPLHNQNECFGLIGLHKIQIIQNQQINPIYLVYTQRNWLEFRRYFLGAYPKNADFFIDECEKYFPELFFHENNRTSIPKILLDFSKKIIFHLSGINDEFNIIRQEYNFLPDALKALTIKCKFDEHATLEGNAESKKRLNFDFENNKKQFEIVCCEPHIKLCKNDFESQEYFFNRIYFHEAKPNIQDGKILVAHIGEHL